MALACAHFSKYSTAASWAEVLPLLLQFFFILCCWSDAHVQRALNLQASYAPAQKLLNTLRGSMSSNNKPPGEEGGSLADSRSNPAFTLSLSQALRSLSLPSPLRLHTQERPLAVHWQWRKIGWQEEKTLDRVPFHVYRIGSYILRNCREIERLFQLPVNNSAIERAQCLLELGEGDLIDLSEAGLLAALFMRYLRFADIRISLDQLAGWPGPEHTPAQDAFLMKFVSSLTLYQQRMLQYYLHVFRQLAAHASVNKMPPATLGLLAAGNVRSPDVSSTASIRVLVQILTALIEREHPNIFTLPISKIIASPDDVWADYPPEVRSDNCFFFFFPFC